MAPQPHSSKGHDQGQLHPLPLQACFNQPPCQPPAAPARPPGAPASPAGAPPWPRPLAAAPPAARPPCTQRMQSRGSHALLCCLPGCSPAGCTRQAIRDQRHAVLPHARELPVRGSAACRAEAREVARAWQRPPPRPGRPRRAPRARRRRPRPARATGTAAAPRARARRPPPTLPPPPGPPGRRHAAVSWRPNFLFAPTFAPKAAPRPDTQRQRQSAARHRGSTLAAGQPRRRRGQPLHARARLVSAGVAKCAWGAARGATLQGHQSSQVGRAPAERAGGAPGRRASGTAGTPARTAARPSPPPRSSPRRCARRSPLRGPMQSAGRITIASS